MGCKKSKTKYTENSPQEERCVTAESQSTQNAVENTDGKGSASGGEGENKNIKFKNHKEEQKNKKKQNPKQSSGSKGDNKNKKKKSRSDKTTDASKRADEIKHENSCRNKDQVDTRKIEAATAICGGNTSAKSEITENKKTNVRVGNYIKADASKQTRGEKQETLYRNQEVDKRKEEAVPEYSEHIPAKSQTKEFEKEYEQMRKQLENFSQDVQKRDKEIQKFKDNIAEKENEIKSLKQKQLEHSAQDVQNRDKEIQKLKDDIAEKENEIKSLKQKQLENSAQEVQSVQSRDKEKIQKLKGDIAAKENEIKSLQLNIKEFGSKEKELAELKSKVKKMTDDEKRMKQEIKTKKKEIDKLETETNEEIEDAANKLSSLKKEKDTALAKKDKEIKKLEIEKEQLLIRLSEMAGRRLTDNNPNIADLSDLNRPTKLAEKYTELYDNEWTDALSYMETLGENKMSETQLIKALMKILTIAYKVSLKTADQQLKTLRGLLNDFHGDSIYRNQQVKDVLKQLKDQRKKSIQPCYKLSKEYRMEIEKEFPKIEPKAFESDALRSYLQRCLELCWLMVIQDPPVHLQYEGLNKGDRFEKSNYKEYTQSGPFVKYIVWPAVFLEKDGALLCKGVVQCDKGFTSSLRDQQKNEITLKRHSSSVRVSGEQQIVAVSTKAKSCQIKDMGTNIATDKSHSKTVKKQTGTKALCLEGAGTKL